MNAEPSDLLDCFQFVEVDIPNAPSRWWPCLRFKTVEFLDRIVQKWNLASHRRPPMYLCDSDSVAFLMGENPPVQYLVDVEESRRKFHPFLPNVVWASLQHPVDQTLLLAISAAAALLDVKIRESRLTLSATLSSQSPVTPSIKATTPPQLPIHSLLRLVSTHGEDEATSSGVPECHSYEPCAIESSAAESSPLLPAPTLTESTSNLVLTPSVESKPIASAVSNTGVKKRVSKAKTKRPATKRPKVSKITVVEPVEFTDVQCLLEQGGYCFGALDSGSPSYQRPCGMTFTSVEAFRNDLCAYGVSCKCVNLGPPTRYKTTCLCWNETERSKIQLWVRSNVIRGPIQLGSTNRMASSSFMPFAKRLGCGHYRTNLGDGYKLPCVENPVVEGILGLTTFFTYLDLLEFLSRYGFPDDCTFDRVSDEELFELEVFLAAYGRDTFKSYPRDEQTLRLANPRPRRPQVMRNYNTPGEVENTMAKEGSTAAKSAATGVQGPPTDEHSTSATIRKHISKEKDQTLNDPSSRNTCSDGIWSAVVDQPYALNAPENTIATTKIGSTNADAAPEASTVASTSISPASTDMILIDVMKSPSFTDICDVLKRGGYQFLAGTPMKQTCRRPGGRRFASVSELRRDLCAYGVNCQCGGQSAKACQCWTESERDLIHCWVRCSVMQGPLRLNRVGKLSMPKLFEYGARLGFTFDTSTGTFRFPNGVSTVSSHKELISNLARFGLPDDCTFSNVTHEERLCVENCLALSCPLAVTFMSLVRDMD